VTPTTSGPVVLTALQPVWLQIYERGGDTLFQGELTAGKTFEVPATARAPLLRTGRPEALKITVGPTVAPAVGDAGKSVADVSLLGDDLLGREPAGDAAAPTPAAASGPTPVGSKPTRTTRPASARPTATAPVPAPVPEPAASEPATPDPTG
jgi:cytoskeleton protein RodZ